MERRRDQAWAGRRRCVCCGCDDDRLQGDAGRLVFECPACGADLYARPARSYAELEGLCRKGPALPRLGVIRQLVSAVYRALVRRPADRAVLGDRSPTQREPRSDHQPGPRGRQAQDA